MQAFDFSFKRTNNTSWGIWLWTVDWILLGTVFLLLAIGCILITTASPCTAHIYGLHPFSFITRHLLFLSLGVLILLVVSHAPIPYIQKTVVTFLLLGTALLICTLWTGVHVKGARRWLSFFFLRLQPIELVRPFFIIANAWWLSCERRALGYASGTPLSLAIAVLIGTCLLLQPDLGMTLVIAFVLFTQFFLAGLSWWLIGTVIFSSFACLGVAFLTLSHVKNRVLGFFYKGALNPFAEGFQTHKSLAAFKRGGWWGKGPGEGIIKHHLPDAHTDFIFSVAAEEFGIGFCLLILGLYTLLLARVFYYLTQTSNNFVRLALGGIMAHVGVQVFINVASTLALIPTKGLPLPLISYGGSSLLGTCILLGFLLALTKKDPRLSKLTPPLRL